MTITPNVQSKGQADEYWAPKKEKAGNEWLLEVVGYVDGMAEKEIESIMDDMNSIDKHGIINSKNNHFEKW